MVINEILANPTGGASDWIELYNTTDEAIDVGGWFLSDDDGDLLKYEIASGTVILADGYLVLDGDATFGNANDPGCHVPFGLSRNGETLHLHSGTDGVLTGYGVQEKFDASEAGVSMGRYLKSTGGYNFVALSEPTPGAANAAPKVGPIVISEIMYNPADVSEAEYVELLNISDAPVTLYDETLGVPWRFTDDPDNPGIELLLPSDDAITLAPGGRLLLVKDTISFAIAYGEVTPGSGPGLGFGQAVQRRREGADQQAGRGVRRRHGGLASRRSRRLQRRITPGGFRRRRGSLARGSRWAGPLLAAKSPGLLWQRPVQLDRRHPISRPSRWVGWGQSVSCCPGFLRYRGVSGVSSL